MTSFLKWLKPFYEAGFIQLLAASGTLLAVCVALWPHFNRWRLRPRLCIEIPRGYVAETILPQIVGNVLPENVQAHAKVAKIRVRNVGKTAAVGVRLTATDFYFFDSGRCSLEAIPESSLPPVDSRTEQLPAGLTMLFSVCGCSIHGDAVSGFRVGGAPAGNGGSIGSGPVRMTFSNGKPTLRPGLHFVRVVASAEATTPTTHFLALEIGDDVQLRLATARERRAIRKADSARTAVEISR